MGQQAAGRIVFTRTETTAALCASHTKLPRQEEKTMNHTRIFGTAMPLRGLLLLSLMLIPAGPLSAKRLPPKPVPPVSWGALVFETEHWGAIGGFEGNGGVLLLREEATGRLLETLRIYSIPAVPRLEGDLRDVFITSVVPDREGGRLVIRTEGGGVYHLFVESREVLLVRRSRSLPDTAAAD